MASQVFWRRALTEPGQIVAIEPDGTAHTAGDLLARVNQLTHGLRARSLRTGDGLAVLVPNGIAALEVGAAAEARVCAGDGALPVWSAGVAAAHRRHHAGRGDPDDPPASAARRGSTCQGSSACPPGSLCVGLCLSAPAGSPTRPCSRRRVGASSLRLVLRLRSPLTALLGGAG